MRYLVTLALKNGSSATLEAIATNKADAEYRASFKCEGLYGPVSHTLACRKAA